MNAAVVAARTRFLQQPELSPLGDRRAAGGLLRIVDMKFSGGEIAEITSVKLDHFSGAPIDKALFSTKVVVGVRLEIALALESRRDADPEKRGGAGDADEKVAKLFKELIEDIRGDGLTLGHGANKGFGWFKFERELSNDR